MSNDNPLLDMSGLPRFSDIEPRHVIPALDRVLDDNRKTLRTLTEVSEPATWDNLVAPLEAASDRLDRVWSPVSHLNGVSDSDALRQVYEEGIAKLTEYAAEMQQDRALFDRFMALRQSGAYDSLDAGQRKCVDNEIRDFRLSGIDLDDAGQARFREISVELSGLQNRFSRNLLDATDAWTLHLADEGQLEGLPESVLRPAARKARAAGLDGWVFTLHGPSYAPFITYCAHRELREQAYRACVTRASGLGPHAGRWDNSQLIVDILQQRHRLAELLGFDDYAHYSLQTRMARSPGEVVEFLRDLAAQARPAALNERAELEDFARSRFGIEQVASWDVAWLSEKLKQDRYHVDQEALRPYFPLPRVLDGLFEIARRLFGVRITRREVTQTWHPKVAYYEVADRRGAPCGYFYVDLYARAHKRGGAWMDECMGRRRVDGGTQLPVSFLVCNFAEPAADRPCLLNHDEVMTLFHEFGHGLHHLLTRVDAAWVAGIRGVPWDAVELPSQFMENWCWQRESLDLVSGHHETGARISDELFEKMHAARNFQSALALLRQVELSLFDLYLHSGSPAPDGPEAVRHILGRVRDEVAVMVPPDFNRFENGFDHVFAGGYAAGYYSYKWAEVLSADAFSRFEEEGIFNPGTGREFLACILEKGGSEEPLELFRRFRGRDPEIHALLRHSGLSPAGAPA